MFKKFKFYNFQGTEHQRFKTLIIIHFKGNLISKNIDLCFQKVQIENLTSTRGGDILQHY